MTENNRLKDLLMVLAAFVVAQLAGLLLVSVLSGIVQGYWYALLVNAVCILGVNVVVYLILCGRPELYRKAENYSRIEPIAFLVTGVFLSCVAVFFLKLVFPQDNSAGSVPEGGDLLLYAAYTLVLAPVTEELAFRGAVLSRLARSFGANSAALVSAVFFAAYHLDVSQMLYTFVLGYFLALLAQRSGSLVICILVHAGNNLITLAAGLWKEFSAVLDICLPVIGTAGLIWLAATGRLFRMNKAAEKE